VTGAFASCGNSYGGADGPLAPPADGGSDAAQADAASDAGPPADAAPSDASAPPCDRTKPFGAPVAVTELNSSDFDAISGVSVDELTIYVATNHNVDAGLQLFYATRPNTAAPWGALQPFFPGGSYDNWGVAVTPDGLTAIVSSDRSGSSSDLYVATRPTTLASFGALGLIAGATNTPADEEGPHWSGDGKTLYFDSTISGNRDLYRTTVNGTTFGSPEHLTELSSTALEAIPVVSADELTIYFASTRAPSPDGDIYVATRAARTDPFSNIQPVASLNSPGFDAPGALSSDGCTLYMGSTRGGTSDIFVARKPK
jgi:hypothetical protein